MLPPDHIDASFFAPCGMNCLVCYKHLGQKPCAGCLSGSENKPAACRACKIKDCAQNRGVVHCFACAKFPCKFIKALDRSYRTRYGVPLAEYSRKAAQQGLEAFLQEHTAQYTCPACGGLISLHDGDCSECKTQYPLGRSACR